MEAVVKQAHHDSATNKIFDSLIRIIIIKKIKIIIIIIIAAMIKITVVIII